MEHLRRKNGKTAEFLAWKSPCSLAKNQEREKKIPTPPTCYVTVWERESY